MTDAVRNGVSDAPRVADLFCGNGTFTGPLLQNGRIVMAADFAAEAISSLQRAGINAVNRNLFKEPLGAYELDEFDAVVIDPPRAGAQAQVKELAKSNVPKIVYVSCNPQTFAKDAAYLIAGGYGFQKLTIVDQFIWSAHAELVGIFEKSC